MTRQIVWRNPRNEFSASIGGIVVPGNTTVQPGTNVAVRVVTMCGKEFCEMSVVVREISTISQVCRQAEIAASIQHVERRACDACRESFFQGIAPDERSWLYANDPRLGRVIGVSGFEGVEGVV